MAAAGAVVPVIKIHPAVPTFVLEISGAGPGVGIGLEVGVIQQAGGVHFVRAEEVIGPASEDVRGVRRSVIDVVVIGVVPALGGAAVIHGSMEREAEVVL